MPIPQSPIQRHISQRIHAVMAHTTRYAFDGVSRLAEDVGVSKSAIYRILQGKRSPSFSLMIAITQALEKELKRPIDPRELMTVSGQYPTPNVCDLCGCLGCAYTPRDQKRKTGKETA